jgi:CheY-like chemotaxis protein
MSTTELTESPIGLRRWDEPEHLPLLAGLHVLVVDDDEDAREAVAGVLETCGAEVVAVGSAPAALALLREARPDVIVSDIAMPGMDGHRLIRTIRTLDAAQGGTTPAAALTAYATPSDRTRALLAGFQVYLAKPFDPIELITLVASLAAKTSAT